MSDKVVYLIGNQEWDVCKIGISDDPERRMIDFNLPFAVELLQEYFPEGDPREVEKKLHKHYLSKRLRLEWFTYIDPQEFQVVAINIERRNKRRFNDSAAV